MNEIGQDEGTNEKRRRPRAEPQKTVAYIHTGFLSLTPLLSTYTEFEV